MSLQRACVQLHGCVVLVQINLLDFGLMFFFWAFFGVFFFF